MDKRSLAFNAGRSVPKNCRDTNDTVLERGFCQGVRLALTAVRDPHELTRLWARYEQEVNSLLDISPGLKTGDDRHVSDFLLEQYAEIMRFLKVIAPKRMTIISANTDVIGKAGEEPANVPIERDSDASGYGHVDKTRLAIATPKRIRKKAHLKTVTLEACLIYGKRPSDDAHRLSFAQPGALGLKHGDAYVVPLCRNHHRAAHASGDERRWWAERGIDAEKDAIRLWRVSKGEGDK